MQLKPIRTRIFKERESLINFILKYVKKVPDRAIIVVTSKIVSLSQSRTVELDPRLDKEKFRERIIKKESQRAVKGKKLWFTVKDGMVMTSAGIDESNGNGKIILLPENSFRVAANLRRKLQKKFRVKNLGVLIVDSRRFPFRLGIFGTALGYAGFKGLKDSRGQPDIFGRVLKFARTNVADSLATAAVLSMGEGAERKPLALIAGAPVEFQEKVNIKELIINPEFDIYLPLFKALGKRD